MMKNVSLKSCSACCCCVEGLLPMLMRLVVGILFVIMGLNKLMTPDMFQGMLADKFSLGGEALSVAFWAVVAFELLGGVILVLARLFPSWLYKLAILGQLVIVVVAYFTVGDLWYHLLLVAALVGLFFSLPRCLFGITGYRK